jgi:hypothetical protein
MADNGPLLIPARNAEHAEYLVRSRAEQRGVKLESIEVSEAGGGRWLVEVVVSDADRESAAHLGDDTQTLHFDTHPSHRR